MKSVKIINRGYIKSMRIEKVISAKKGLLVVKDSNGTKFKRSSGTVAWRCNNPGNLKNGPFSRSMGSIGQDHIGHAVFPTREHGLQAQFVLLFGEDSRYYNMTLKDAIRRYAPSGDANNEPDKYSRWLSNKTDIDLNTKLKTLSQEKRVALLESMHIYEGYKEGKDTKVK